jgi:putative ABC transport system permease protein
MPVPRYEVIGVVGDVLATIDGQRAAMLYRPLLGLGNSSARVLLHTAVEPTSVVGVARDILRRMDPGLAISQVRTVEELLSSSTSNRQFNMSLLATFAGLALLLAAIGLYGLVSHMVSQRRTEIGIRLALGATRRDMNRLILLQGLKPALAGVALGLIGSGFAAPVLRAQLFGITPLDMWTFATVPLVLLVMALLACCIPARRASLLDPTTALRSE